MEITLELLSRVFQEEEHSMRGINYPFIDMAFGSFGSVSVGNTYRTHTPSTPGNRTYGENIETEDMPLPEKNTYYYEKYLDELDSRSDAREAYRKKWAYYN